MWFLSLSAAEDLAFNMDKYRKLSQKEVVELAKGVLENERLEKDRPPNSRLVDRSSLVKVLAQTYSVSVPIWYVVLYLNMEYNDEVYDGTAQFLEAFDFNNKPLTPSVDTGVFLSLIRGISVRQFGWEEDEEGAPPDSIKYYFEGTPTPDLYVKVK